MPAFSSSKELLTNEARGDFLAGVGGHAGIRG
jgi:hypothetical protein